MRFAKLLSEVSEKHFEKTDIGFGVTAEFLGGVTGVILGILSILKLSPMILLPVAVVVYGGDLDAQQWNDGTSECS